MARREWLERKQMKLYCVHFHDYYDGAMLSWYSSKKEANKQLKQQQKKQRTSLGPEEIYQVTFPRGKANIIRWLNTHCNRNNG